MSQKNTRRGPVIRSSSYGYVIENFMGPDAAGNVTDYLTDGGKIIIIPDKESIPPYWLPYAQPATPLQAAVGKRWPKIVHIIEEEDMRR